MTRQEGFPATPFLSAARELECSIGTLDVDAVAITDLPASYGLTMESIGVRAIRFSPYTTEYDADTATLMLGVLDQDAPPNVVNPPRQHRSTLAHRSVPASNRPSEYFAKRSEELSRTLVGMVLERAVEVGYRSPEMQDLQDGRKVARGGVHVLAVVASAIGLYYAGKLGFFDTPVGAAMPLGGVAVVVGLDGLAVSESRTQEAEDLRSVTERQKLEVEAAAPTDLIRITPPGPRRQNRPVVRPPKSRKNRNLGVRAGGSQRGL